jgi:pyruvate,orthophosphate dikinase
MNPRAIYYRRMNKIEGLIGTAVNVQSMVFGNFSTKSGTGVAFSRSPATGENKFFGEFLINAQGEDVVAGVRTPMHIDEMAKHFPNAYKELTEIYKKLENHYRDVQDLEFTVQDEILYMLQTRNAKRTAKAAIKIAVDLVSEGLITKKEAILRMDSAQLDHLLHKQLDPEEKKKIKPIGKGIPASPGAAVGKIAFNNEEAVQMKKNKFPVILVRPETSPEDLIGMDAASGILTSTGGTTSHAAVVARTMGKTCISGCTEAKVNEAKGTLTIGDDVFKSGDFITLDGTEGKIYKGVLKVIDPEFSDEFYVFMGWEKEFRQLGVRANGDTPLDAERAIKFGAEGIGLCRTEHMFFDKDRIKVVREMILSKDEKGRRAVLEKIKPFQQKDFYELFKTMDGRPITIRLLDPPLHEFLPQDEEQIKELAEDLKYSVLEVKETIKSLHEINPMLGHRGCRLGISYPEITEMQAEAIFSAVKQIVDEGLPCDPEIMIPLIGTKKEFTLQKEILDKIALKILGGKTKYKIGTMIETPRAAIVSASIATEAEFFSFGTNDLTQMTFGYSRDDSNKFLPDYVEKYNILSASPFEVLDQEGVGFLMQKSVTDGRSINSKLKVGICGEHGGDPSSIDFCQRIGLDYVSCSPFRVFIARLAAAQSAIKNSQKK